MRRKYLLLATGLVFGFSLPGQIRSVVFQLFMQDGGLPGQTSIPLPQPEPGKPFSAMATTETRQTLSDGTNITQTTTVLEYRDAEGRVRSENGRAATGSSPQTNTITVRDPVAGVGYTLNPIARTGFKTVFMKAVARGGSGGVGGRGGSGTGALSQALRMDPPLISTPSYQTVRNNIVEDLGVMTVNGVQARGTRTTTIVRVGLIGNDREFRSVSERWFSPDLNLLVKSVNTDPRFGTTTYELMNISRTPPDTYLFQVPGDYTIVNR